MKKQSKYRPKPVYVNAIASAVERATPIGGSSYYTDMLLKNHGAMMALTRGTATKKEMDCLVAMSNIMEALRRLCICAPLSDEIAAGRRAIIDICLRSAKLLRFVATGPEIKTLNTLMELHDELMPHITGIQLDRAIDLAKKIIQRGEATVINFPDKTPSTQLEEMTA